MLRHKSALVALAAATGAVLGNQLVARQTNRNHPADGDFVDVDGVRLHYSDRGEGSPVVLIHGNTVSGSDWNSSGVTDLLLHNKRVIIFDRPGCGHSGRPRNKMWTAAQQAELIGKALAKLKVSKPVLVGHSWGAIVALSFAQRHPSRVAGLVLVSGYYFWTLRPDVIPTAAVALPIFGDALRYTLAPMFGWMQMPALKRALFWPSAVPARFEAEFSPAMALRPSQLRATSVDAALMLPAVMALRRGYRRMKIPVAIIAGDSDKIVFKRGAERLSRMIPGSILQIVANTGHMVHHTAPGKIADLIERMGIAPASAARA